MEMIAILATIILIATLATLVFAFAAYFITKAKRKKAKQKPIVSEDKKTQRTYFKRYVPDGESIYAKEILAEKGSDKNQWM